MPSTLSPGEPTVIPETVLDPETEICFHSEYDYLETWVVKDKTAAACPNAAIDHFTASFDEGKGQFKLRGELCSCSEKCLGQSGCNEFHILPSTNDCVFGPRGDLMAIASFTRTTFCERTELLALAGITSNHGSLDLELFARIGNARSGLQMNVVVICGGVHCGSGEFDQLNGVNWSPLINVKYLKPTFDASYYVARVSLLSTDTDGHVVTFAVIEHGFEPPADSAQSTTNTRITVEPTTSVEITTTAMVTEATTTAKTATTAFEAGDNAAEYTCKSAHAFLMIGSLVTQTGDGRFGAQEWSPFEVASVTMASPADACSPLDVSTD